MLVPDIYPQQYTLALNPDRKNVAEDINIINKGIILFRESISLQKFIKNYLESNINSQDIC